MAASKEAYIPLSNVDVALETDAVLHKDENDRVSVEELVERIVSGSTRRYWVFLPLVFVARLCGSMLALHPIFTGYIPYTEWECLSQRCFDLLSNHSLDANFYSRDTMCSNKLVTDVDFVWTPTRTSFAIDWGIYCEKEEQKSSINSFFFIGALVGLLTSSSLYDRFGRKRVILVTAVISVSTTLAQVFSNSFSMMLGLRVVQGLGVFVANTGVYVLLMEFTPLRLRPLANSIITFSWPTGTAILILASYFVLNWQYTILFLAIFNLVTYLPIVVFPESARLLAVQGNEKEALKVLKRMAKYFNKPLDPNTRLKDAEDDNPKSKDIFKQFKDFGVHPVMLKRTGFLMVCWFLVSLFSYALTFGWHKMGSDIYTSQGFAIISSCISVTLATTVVSVVGRKKSQIISFLGISVFYLVAMIQYPISSTWNVSQIACLVVNVFIGSEWIIIYLYTVELSPTSHRGMILCVASSTARVGAFLGPYIPLLYDLMNRSIVMGMFAGLAILVVVGTWFCLDDTTGQTIPETPADIGRNMLLDGKENGKRPSESSDSVNKAKLLSESK